MNFVLNKNIDEKQQNMKNPIYPTDGHTGSDE